MECRRTFNKMVYSVGRLPGAEALEAHRKLSSHLSFKLKREHSKRSGVVRARMSMAIMISNSLILCNSQEK